MIKRCINLDWLEVYAIESNIGYPHNAEFFRKAGWTVQERDYGTPTYKEMFTLYSFKENEPLIEVRRNPKSSWTSVPKGFLDPYCCHIRLVNRSCYLEDAAGIMQQFLERYMFAVSRISRLDLCLDFERFDTGDYPSKFLQRYMEGKFSKLNQGRVSVNGTDWWSGRVWNSVRWGADKSMVTTKLYNKTMELQEVRDKPYIRQAWFQSGLIDDWYDMTKHDKDGQVYTPEIWRLEFSIKSSVKNWFVVEESYPGKTKYRSIRHTLDQYHTRAQILDVFWSLAFHYFHFKHYEPDKRKDRCRDKVLFRHEEPAVFYKLAAVSSSEPLRHIDKQLLKLLLRYRDTVIDIQEYIACNLLIEKMELRVRMQDKAEPMPPEVLTLLRQLISMRVKDKSRPLEEDAERLRQLIESTEDAFMEMP